MNVIPARPELEHVPPVPHGGHNSTLPPVALRDFSANINPYGPSPRIWAAMQAVPIAQHPDPRATPLRHALAAHTGVDPAAVLVGNGAADLIYQLATAYIRRGDRVVIVTPTFGEYAAAARMMGATLINHPTHPADGFALDLPALLATVQRTQPRLLFLCNPNNPTCTYYDQATIAALLHACPHTLLILDEAFVSFVAQPWPAVELLTHANLLILRSLTKDYALTGLRVGYALGHPATIAAIEKVQPPWTVNALAQAATLAALADTTHLATTLAQIRQASSALRTELVACGFAPLPSAVHFMLVPVHAAAVWQAMLLERGMLVRDCSSFGLPQHIRIAPQLPEDNRALVQAMQACQEQLCQVA